MNILNQRHASIERIKNSMFLREPQLQAVEKLHEVFCNLAVPLHSASRPEVAEAFLKVFPKWKALTQDSPFAELTVALATGVGKTKAIGALIAYLFNSGDCKNFMIVTPRAEIIRKFIRELSPASQKYMFTDPCVIYDPEVITADNLFSKNLHQQNLFDFDRPNIWVFTPQSFTAKGARLKTESDNGLPTTTYLRRLTDLVIFFDESHHLGSDGTSVSVWKKELQTLNPRLIVGTTASLQPGANVLYSYSLKKCLREKRYTKRVQIIAEKLDQGVSPEDQDHIALRYALDRRDLKEEAVREYAQTYEKARCPQPVLLVCCSNVEHAEHTYEWLREYLGDRAVRIIHNEKKEEEYISWLIGLEDDSSEVKVIVQVSMLNEGWDVSTVYGICPLRQMNSITMVEQVMGRGLRLPFGSPTGDQMVDELDIILFGRETVNELANQAINAGYGSGEFQTRNKDEATKPTKNKEFVLPHAKRQGHPLHLEFPFLRRRFEPLALDRVNIPKIELSEIHGFEISDPKTIRDLGGSPLIERTELISAICSLAIKRLKFISASNQYEDMKRLVDRLLSISGLTGHHVNLNPEIVAAHVAGNLEEIYRAIPPRYDVVEGAQKTVSLLDAKTFVVESFQVLAESTIQSERDWSEAKAARQVIGGWARCVHECVAFDSYGELAVARCIDRSSEVGWWFRNLPGMLTLDTPAGRYSPDFGIFLALGSEKILLEVKGDVFVNDAAIKRAAAELWCEAISDATGQKWSYWFLMESDIAACSAWSDVVSRADKS